MSLSRDIRTAYFMALNGNLYLNGNMVPVLDSFAPDEMPAPYVVLSTQTVVEDSSKTCRGYNTTILLDIVTKFQHPSGRGQSEEIAQQIEDIISPDRSYDIIGYETAKDMDTDIVAKSGTQYVYRKLLTYRHLI